MQSTAGMTQVVFHKTRPEQFRFSLRFYFLERGFMGRLVVVVGLATFLVFCEGAFLYIGASFLAVVLYTHAALIHALWKGTRTSPYLDLPVTLSFDESSISFATATTTLNFKWESFAHRSEDADYFHLFEPAAVFPTAIPKRAFSPEQREEFERCIVAIPWKTRNA